MNVSFTRAALSRQSARGSVGRAREPSRRRASIWLAEPAGDRDPSQRRHGSTIRFAGSSAAGGRSATTSSTSVCRTAMFSGPGDRAGAARRSCKRITWTGRDSRFASARRARRHRSRHRSACRPRRAQLVRAQALARAQRRDALGAQHLRLRALRSRRRAWPSAAGCRSSSAAACRQRLVRATASTIRR